MKVTQNGPNHNRLAVVLGWAATETIAHDVNSCTMRHGSAGGNDFTCDEFKHGIRV